ncbi:hypothetical protein BDW68DRAFT_161202 [Aspergillus falconensis]
MPDEVAQYFQLSLTESQRMELSFLVVTMFGLHAKRQLPGSSRVPGNEVISHLRSFCKLLSEETLKNNEAENEELALLGLRQIGELLRCGNDLVQAEKFYLKAVRGSERILGRNNVQYLERCFNLGTLYQELGRLQQAEEFLLIAAHGYEETSGLDETETQDAFDFLAMTYKDLQRVNDAVDIHSRVVERRKTVLGPENIYTLTSIYRLGMAYRAQGELEKAEETIKQTWQGFRKGLGPRHQATLNIVAYLGSIANERNDLALAEEYYNQAFEGFKSIYGPNSDTTLRLAGDLATIRIKWGKLEEAETILLEFVHLKGDLEDDQPNLPRLKLLSRLAFVYTRQERPWEAEMALRRVLSGYEKIFGHDHAKTLEIVKRLDSELEKRQ